MMTMILSRATIRSWLCVVLICGVLAGCGLGGRSGVEISYNDPLRARISEVLHSKQPTPLSDLTDFDWDEVHLFNEYDSREKIQQIVGSQVAMNDDHTGGSLLIFKKGGKVVRAITTTADFIRADQSTWPADVLLVPWGAGALRLTLPPAAEQHSPQGNSE